MPLAGVKEMTQEKYRKGCSYVRKGHEIFRAVDGKRSEKVKSFIRSVGHDRENSVRTPDKGTVLPAINAAKRWVRTQPPGSVFVED
jgi:hypothetical protein